MATPQVAADRAVQRASRTRNWVIVFAITLAILSLIDRVCIAQAQSDISRDLGFSKSDMGKVFAAFGVGYALFEIPGGWMGDKMGVRKVLMRIVLWWSFFTAATGYMWSVGSMWVCRFLFGVGEAGCFPNLTKAFSIWLPQNEKTRAQGIMWMAARWGGAITPILVVWVLRFVNWRQAFMMFGSIGLLWAFFFYRWYRDNPATHKGVNPQELAIIGSSASLAESHGDVPWKKLFTSRNIWLIWLQYFCLSYPWYFYITWLPTYLREHHSLSAMDGAKLAFLPLFFGGLGCLLCGLLLPPLSRKLGSVSRARRMMATIGFSGAGLLLLLSINTPNATTAMFIMGLASFCNDLVMPSAWASCMDVGGRYAGTVAGSMNMMGNVAGFTAPVIGGYILELQRGTWNVPLFGAVDGASVLATTGGNWNLFLYTMAAMYILGALIWPMIDPVTPLEAEH